VSSKNAILDNIKRNIKEKHEMPAIKIEGIQYSDKIAQFIDISKGVGGNAVILKEGEDVNSLIKSLYPDAKNIGSNVKGISIATFSPDDVEDPHTLDGTDLGIIQGEVGVAENGCVWIPQNVRQKAIYFISEYLVILLNKKNIVNNMHEAYNQIKFSDTYGFGIFISGPSKTADIEQALVVGAHGAKGVTVILR
jgi:L-lactate dehydrogenase complex protein LldG